MFCLSVLHIWLTDVQKCSTLKMVHVTGICSFTAMYALPTHAVATDLAYQKIFVVLCPIYTKRFDVLERRP